MILYIEDNLSNQLLIEQVVKQLLQAELLLAKDAESGIALAEEKIPDVMLMDINLPGIDGYEAMARLKEMEKLKNIPVIALTGCAMSEDIKRGEESGFFRYLIKPVAVDELADAITEALG